MATCATLDVPSIRLAGGVGGRPYAEYEIVLRDGDASRSSFKRWSEVAEAYPRELPAGPPMPFKLLTNEDLAPAHLSQRRAQLESFLRWKLRHAPASVLSFLLPRSPSPPEGVPAKPALTPATRGRGPRRAAEQLFHSAHSALRDLQLSFASPPPRVSTPREAAAEAAGGAATSALDLAPTRSPERCAHTPTSMPSRIPIGRWRSGQAQGRLAASPSASRADSAAAVLQRHVRTRRCRVRGRAAATVQAAWRGRVARRRLAAARQIWRGCAATHLQRIYRGAVGRGRVRAALRLWYACSALHLQRVMRGGLARKQLRRVVAARMPAIPHSLIIAPLANASKECRAKAPPPSPCATDVVLPLLSHMRSDQQLAAAALQHDPSRGLATVSNALANTRLLLGILRGERHESIHPRAAP